MEKAEIQNLPLIKKEDLEKKRFELHVNDQIAFLEYRLKGNVIYLIHTEVPETISGMGIAAILVTKVFEYIEEHHLRLVPYCPYVKIFLKRHPEYERLL